MSNLNEPSSTSPPERPSEGAEAGGVPPNGPISLQPVPPAPTTTASHASAEATSQSRQGLTPETLKAELVAPRRHTRCAPVGVRFLSRLNGRAK